VERKEFSVIDTVDMFVDLMTYLRGEIQVEIAIDDGCHYFVVDVEEG
jgi:hypothetical protein